MSQIYKVCNMKDDKIQQIYVFAGYDYTNYEKNFNETGIENLFNKQELIYINKKNAKSYELLMGPYNSINKLKNDYIVLNDSHFEDLDIIIND